MYKFRYIVTYKCSCGFQIKIPSENKKLSKENKKYFSSCRKRKNCIKKSFIKPIFHKFIKTIEKFKS